MLHVALVREGENLWSSVSCNQPRLLYPELVEWKPFLRFYKRGSMQSPAFHFCCWQTSAECRGAPWTSPTLEGTEDRASAIAVAIAYRGRAGSVWRQ